MWLSQRALWWPALVAALTWASPGRAQEPTASLRLRILGAGVVESPVNNAQVTLLDLERGAVSNERGVVRLEGIPAGPHLVEVRRIGYATERFLLGFPAGGEVEGEVLLLVSPVRLEEIVASADRRDPYLASRGFYDRMRFGFGHFLHGEELERKTETRVDFYNLFYGIPGVRVAMDGRGGRRLVSSRGPTTLFRRGRSMGCPLTIFLDGMRLFEEPGFAINPEDIAAIEVYTGIASAPAEFPTWGSCGVIAIWSKFGM